MKNATKKMYWLLIMVFLFPSCQFAKSVKTQSCGKNTVAIRTTAYTANEKDHLKYKKKTACGTTLKVNQSIATDWSQFPVGTVLRINNEQRVVDDYGKFIEKADKYPIPTVDIYQPTRKSMNQWGVKFFDNVEIVQMGSFEKSLEILKDRLKYSHCRLMYERILEKI